MPEPGQEAQRRSDASTFDDRGYIMVALLIGVAVVAVWMGALLPAWNQQATREKEAQLIYNGEAYARAIALFFRRNQTLPPNLDILVQQRFLRRKYLDPITNKEFLPVGGVQSLAGRGQAPGVNVPPVSALAGIFGVRSTSNKTSIRVYQGQTTYSQFPFDYQIALQRMGTRLTPGGGPGNAPGRRGAPGGRGVEMSPIGPGQRGRGPGPAGPGRLTQPPRGGTPGPAPTPSPGGASGRGQ